MNINNMVNPKAAAKTAWPEDGVQRGKTSYEKAAAAAKDGTAVKPVSYEGSKKTADTKSQNGLSSGIYNASAAEKEKEKTVSAEEKEQKEDTQKALEKTADTMTEKDCETLEEEGMTLEAYEAERLNRAIARIKENRQFEKENLEGRMERQKEYDQEIQKIALKNKIPDSTARKLGQKLIEAGLPLTEANIMAMVQALNLGAGVNEMPDSGMAYIIENNQEATIENVYNASYAGAAAIPAGEEAWEAVKSQIEEVIEKSGRPVNEETLENGKWLLDHELPVNEETLEQLENLQGIREEADEAYLLDRMTEAMVKGKTPKEANLDLEAVRSRRQLEEIRLSMSEGASRALEEKGIVIDTENMKQVIEELKKIENTYYKALLEETGGEIRPEQVNLLKETMEKADAAGQGPALVLGKTLESRHVQTLETLYQETELLKQKAQKAAEAYEPLRTAPQKALGDSIQKAFQNVDVLLKELGLENTKDNQRAVRILGYNQMEITQDNIGQIKAYDARVNEVLAGLKPAVTVELIRRGENPLNMTFEELKQSIDQIQESIGADAEEKYSTYLWKLEKQEGITAEERKSYIGIYRLLNHIEKTDGAAIGNVVNAGRELTLSNLLTAVRTIKNKGINQKIDDNFGGLTEISFASETITEQIESAFPKDDRTDYLQSLVKRTMEGLSPEQVVETFKNADGNGMDMSLEQFCERAMEQEKDAALEREYQKEQVKIFRETAENSSEAAAFLNAHGAEATVRNIQAAEAWFAGNRNLFKELDKKADNISKEKKDGYRKCAGELLESMSEEDSFREEYQKTVDSMKEIVSAEFADRELVSDEAENLRLMQKGILLASRLSRQEHYEMPVVIGEEVSSLSLTILKGTMDSGKAEIRIDFPEQGVMEATLTIKNNEIKGFILCKTTEGQQLIESCLEDMKKGFESLGLTVKQMHTGTDRKAAKRSIPENTPEGRPTETRMLYQAAKVLVKQTIERTQVINNEN